MANYTPREILNYVLEQNLESNFLVSIETHVGNYSIGEIVDKKFIERDGKIKFVSPTYQVNVEIQDDEIITAVKNQLYISAFISRYQEQYQVHFLVHQYPTRMKEQFEEEICEEVVRYMIMKTILTLRLDSYEKIQNYISK